MTDTGEIHGAFGSFREPDASRRSIRGRLLALAAIVGPGLIVMVGDNDAGGVQTYAQAGQNFGYSLLWTLPLIIPILVVNQEMVVRLGAVTGVGYARLIAERFGKSWARFSVGCLFLLNLLTISTEFIGVSLALEYLGISKDLSIPFAAVGLVAMTATGSYRRWERFMLLFVFVNFLIVPLAILAHPSASHAVTGFVTPRVAGGLNSTSVVFIIAMIGTTVAPWQLFFQQSNIVDKRITPRHINYERVDTLLGAFVTVISATLLIVATASAFGGTRYFHHYLNGGAISRELAHTLGHGTGVIFAVILLNASIIGAAAVTLTTSYAFGDLVGMRSSLDRSFKEAKSFYALFSGIVVVGAGIVLIPHAPLGIITESVQALAGVLLPSTTVFALLLCNDAAVLGPWVNGHWLNAFASLIVAVLLSLSLMLVVTTVFPSINVIDLALAFGAAIVTGAVGTGVRVLLKGPIGLPRPAPKAGEPPRETWRMPPSALFEPAPSSRARQMIMSGLAGTLVLTLALLLVKTIQLGLGH